MSVLRLGRSSLFKVGLVAAAVLLSTCLLALVAMPEQGQAQTAPSGTLDANTLPTNPDYNLWSVVGGTSGEWRSAQTFTALNSGLVVSAQVDLYREDFADTDVVVQIASVDASGVPTENVLAATTVPFSTVPVGQPGVLVTASFDSPAAVQAGQQYALVLSAPGGDDTGLDSYGWRFKNGDPLPNEQPWVDPQLGPVWYSNENPDGPRDLVFGIYVASYNFSGFYQPVDNLPTLNKTKPGKTIPIRFSLGGDKGLNIFADGYPKSEAIPCDSTATVDGIEETVTGKGGLSYNASIGRYEYDWATSNSWSGCRQFVMKLKDGSVQRANFIFR